MKIDFDVPLTFKDKPIQGKVAGDILFQFLSNYGNLTGELKVAVSHILGEIVTAEDEVELNEKEVNQLSKAWHQACEDEGFTVPLMYDQSVEKFLQDKRADFNG